MKTVVDLTNKIKSYFARLSQIAPVENETSTHAYSVGEQLIYNATLYTVTSAIAIGDTLTVGTNITASANLTEQMAHLVVIMTGATSSANGSAGYVPAPLKADRNKFLKGNGTFDNPAAANTTYDHSASYLSETNVNAAIDKLSKLVGKSLTPQTLAAGSTSLTFNDASITTNSTIDVRVSVTGVAYENITVTTGSAVVTFPAQENPVSVYIIVRERG